MKLILKSVAAVSLFVLAACAGGSTNVSFPQSSETRDQAYEIPANIIPAVETDALRGDGDAALKLFFHHEYYALDHRNAMYWLQIAAEDGSRAAARHLGDMMKADNDEPRHYLRADFWLQRAGK